MPPASCSSCPRFRFRENLDGLWKICACCSAWIRSALRHDKRSNEGIYFSALRDVACWRGQKCLHHRYDYFWIRIAREIVVLLFNIGFCKQSAVS